MSSVNYRVLCIEGGDQIGKGDSFLNLKNHYLSKGINITTVSLPIYSTPIGTVVRRLLKEGAPATVLKKHCELNIRMALFALNRLEFMNTFISEKKYRDSLILFDRSPFSNALTIAYALANVEDIKEKDISKYVDTALDFDRYLIKTLNLERCVVQLYDDSKSASWATIRGKKNEDMYERREVQERCDDVYKIYQEKIGKNWRKVATKINGKWRDREDISKELQQVVDDAYLDMELIKDGQCYSINFNEIVPNLYFGAKWGSDDLKKYIFALENNVKDDMYEYAVKLGMSVANSVKEVRFENSEVRSEFVRIIGMNDGIYEIFEYFLGNEFLNKFKKGLKM